MAVDLVRMRRCFVVAATWNDWADGEQAELGAAIKAAIEADDEAALIWWAEYLEQASGLEYLEVSCRAIEASVRAERDARRKAASL